MPFWLNLRMTPVFLFLPGQISTSCICTPKHSGRSTSETKFSRRSRSSSVSLRITGATSSAWSCSQPSPPACLWRGHTVSVPPAPLEELLAAWGTLGCKRSRHSFEQQHWSSPGITKEFQFQSHTRLPSREGFKSCWVGDLTALPGLCQCLVIFPVKCFYFTSNLNFPL